ncbi:MAG: hypothetical protein ACTSRC_22525, partial [Candidatus Helarchaeota archaeon]
IEEKVEFVVVGGYAVSGLAKHRFSVDCDIVISKASLKDITNLLEAHEFEKTVIKAGFDNIYGGEFIKFKKSVSALPISVDLLINSLVCRQTAATWSFQHIWNHSVEVNISGLETSIICRVPQRELLVAFKLHSARKTDVRDIIMLNENLNIERLLEELRRGDLEALKRQLSKIGGDLTNPNLIDSLKGVFTLVSDVQKKVEATKALLKAIEGKI